MAAGCPTHLIGLVQIQGLAIQLFVCCVPLIETHFNCFQEISKAKQTKTRGPRTLTLCLTPATGVTNGNFLQTYFIVAYGLAPLQDIRLQNLSDLEFDLSRSLKVICDDVIGLPIYDFLLMFNSNLWPKSAASQDIRLRNLSDLEFDRLRSLKVNCDSAIELSIYAFLIMFNSNIWHNSAPLQDIRLQNLSDLE